MFALLYNVPQDPGEWLGWGEVHQNDHFIIARQIQTLFAPQSPVYILPITPIPIYGAPGQMLTWAMNHQNLHNAMSDATGVEAFDFSDLSDPKQLPYWINLHAEVHAAVSQALYQQIQQANAAGGATVGGG